MKPTHDARENWREEKLEKFVLPVDRSFIWGLLAGGLLTFIITSSDILSRDFSNSLVPEAVGILFTVFVIDQLNKRQIIDQQKKELILQMGSPNNGFALEAVRKLRHYGWLTDGSIQRANFGSADLHKAKLHEASLQSVFFANANLQDANFGHSNLQRSNFMQANLQETYFGNADLQNASFIGANMQNADLLGASLRKTALTEVNLQEAKLRKANLQGAFMWKADLRNAIDIQLAIMDRDTTLPNGDRWYEGYDLSKFTDPNHSDFWDHNTPMPKY